MNNKYFITIFTVIIILTASVLPIRIYLKDNAEKNSIKTNLAELVKRDYSQIDVSDVSGAKFVTKSYLIAKTDDGEYVFFKVIKGSLDSGDQKGEWLLELPNGELFSGLKDGIVKGAILKNGEHVDATVVALAVTLLSLSDGTITPLKMTTADIVDQHIVGEFTATAINSGKPLAGLVRQDIVNEGYVANISEYIAPANRLLGEMIATEYNSDTNVLGEATSVDGEVLGENVVNLDGKDYKVVTNYTRGTYRIEGIEEVVVQKRNIDESQNSGAIVVAPAPSLYKGSVTSYEIKDLSITTIDIADNSITGAKIVNDTIKNEDLADGAIDSGKISDGSIISEDIKDDTISAADLSGSLLFSDGDFLDLSAIAHNDSALQGLRLPNTSASPVALTSGEGYLAWDTTNNLVLVYNGSAWGSIGGNISLYTTVSDTSTTSSVSGLELLNTDEISLIRGCADTQILKWNDTSKEWECSNDSGAGGSGVSTIQEANVSVVTSATQLDFSNDFNITDNGGGEGGVAIDYTNSKITRSDQGESISGAWSFGNGLTVSSGSVTLPAGTISNTELANSSVTIAAGTGLSGGGAVSLGGSVNLASTLGTTIENGELTSDTIDFDSISDTLTLDGNTSISALSALGLSIGNNVTLSATGTGAITATDLSCTNCIGATEISDLTLGTDTAGNYVAGATSNGGLELTGTEGATLGILLPSATNGLSATTSSGSGLELTSSGLSLLQGCGDGEILKWNETADTWGCSADATGGGSGTLDDSYNNGGSITVDAYDVKFNLTDATNDYAFVVDNASTGDIANAIEITTTGVGGTFGTGIVLSDGGIGNAIDVGGNNITGTSYVLEATSALVLGDATTGADAATVAIYSSDWEISTTGAITGVSFDANGTGNSITNIENTDLVNDTIDFDKINSSLTLDEATTISAGGALSLLIGDNVTLTTTGTGVIVASDLSCTNCISGTEIDESGLSIASTSLTDTSSLAYLANDQTFTGANTFDIAEAEDLAITWSVSGTQSGQGELITITNSSSSGTQTGITINNAASTGTTDALLYLDNSDTDTAVTSAIQIANSSRFTNILTVGATNLTATELVLLDGRSGTLLDTNNVAASLSGWDQNSSDDLTTGNYTSTLDSVYVNVGESPTAADIGGSFSGGLTINSGAVDDTELADTLSYTGALTLSQNLNANGGLDVDDAFVVADGGAVSTISISDTNIPFTGGDTTFDLSAAATRTLTFTNSDGSNVLNVAVEGDVSAATVTVGGDTIDEFVGAGLALSSNDVTVDQSYGFAWTGQQSWTNTLTATGSIQDINFTLGDDADTDIVTALNIDVTSAATGDADTIYGINIGNLTSADGTVLERAIRIGSGWDAAFDFNGTLVTSTEAGVLASGINYGELVNSGTLTVTTADINGGNIDGTAIGASSPSTAIFTTLGATGAIDFADASADTITIGDANDTTSIAGSAWSIDSSGVATGITGITADSVSFDNVTSATNTNALVIGNGGSLTTSGTGTITATDLSCTNCIGGTEIDESSLSIASTSLTDTSSLAYLANDQSFTGANTFDIAEAEDLAITWSVSGTQSGQGELITITNSSSSGTQTGLTIDNAASTGTTDALLYLDNSDTDTVVTNAIQIANSSRFTNILTIGATNLTATELGLLDGRSGTLLDTNNVAASLSGWDQNSSDDLTTGNYAATLDSIYVNVGESPAAGDISGSFSGGLTIDSGAVGDTELADTLTYTGNLTLSNALTLANSETISVPTDATFTFTRNTAGTVTITSADDDANAALNIVAGGTGILTLDSGSGTVTIASGDTLGNGTWSINSSGVGTALTANDLSCTDCIGPTEISDLTLGTDTAGNYVAGATTDGGLELTGTEGGTLGVLLPTATNGLSATVNSGSGLELTSAGLSLLQGCGDGEILKWDENNDYWYCTSDATGGSTAWDAIGDPTGDGAIAFGTTEQTMDWDFTTTAHDGFTFNFDNNGGTAGADSGVVINNAVSTNAAGDLNTENLLLIQQLDTTASGTTVVDNAIKIDSAASSGITDGIEITNSAGDITNAINIVDTGGGSITTGIVFSGTFTNIFDIGGTALSGSEITILDSGINYGELTDSGTLTVTAVDINGGAIDGTIIGANSAAAGTFSSVTSSGAIAANGGITFDDSTDTLGAFTAAGTIDLATNLLINIGNAGTDFNASGGLTLADALGITSGGITVTAGGATITSGALAVNSDSITSDGTLTIDANGSVVFGGGGNTFTISESTGPLYAGNARPTKVVTLTPEFPGAVLTGDGSNNTGTMTSDFCSTVRSINSAATPTNASPCDSDLTEEHTYYSWATSQGTAQDYDIWVRWQVPSDFDEFSSATAISFYGWRTSDSSSVTLYVYDNDGDICGDGAAITGTAGAWDPENYDDPTSCDAVGGIEPGETITFRAVLSANSSSDIAKMGEISVSYFAKF